MAHQDFKSDKICVNRASSKASRFSNEVLKATSIKLWVQNYKNQILEDPAQEFVPKINQNRRKKRYAGEPLFYWLPPPPFLGAHWTSVCCWGVLVHPNPALGQRFPVIFVHLIQGFCFEFNMSILVVNALQILFWFDLFLWSWQCKL